MCTSLPHYGLAVALPSLLLGNERKAQILVLLQSAFRKYSHHTCFVLKLEQKIIQFCMRTISPLQENLFLYDDCWILQLCLVLGKSEGK